MITDEQAEKIRARADAYVQDSAEDLGAVLSKGDIPALLQDRMERTAALKELVKKRDTFDRLLQHDPMAIRDFLNAIESAEKLL